MDHPVPFVSSPAALDLAIGGADAGDSLHRLRSAIAEICTALHETLRDDRVKAAECLQRAGAILETAQRPAKPSTHSVQRGLAPWQVRRVLLYVEEKLETRIRNRDLAAVARLSEFHFNVAFRNSIGQSPHDYILQRRVERAQGLMLASDKTLAEIADECGLADQSHFTRLFRRFVGESPAAWRRARATPRE